MDGEYRLAWANIEGWTTNRRLAIYPPRRGNLSDIRFVSSEKSVFLTTLTRRFPRAILRVAIALANFFTQISQHDTTPALTRLYRR